MSYVYTIYKKYKKEKEKYYDFMFSFQLLVYIPQFNSSHKKKIIPVCHKNTYETIF